MRNVWTLLLTLTVSTFFIHVPHVGEIGFLMHPTMIDPCTGQIVEIKLSYNQYVWWFCQMLQIAALAVVIWDESRVAHLREPKERKMLTRIYSAYLWIILSDMLVHVLAYYDPLKEYRITWNIIKSVIFLGVIAHEKRWLQKRWI